MNVTLLQSELIWQDPPANRAAIEGHLQKMTQTDLLILPEMFTTGFTMDPKKFAEKMNGASISWLQEIAAKKNCAITGSLIIEEDHTFYNRMVFITSEGDIQYYDKRHLFSFAGENNHYSKGSEKVIVKYRGWKILLQICYDLRFPVFSRNIENYDLAIYVANWPEPRIHAWNTLLMARAIENMAYVIGVNRIGTDANNHSYPGKSQVIDPLGNVQLDAREFSGMFPTTLDKDLLNNTRTKFAFLNDKDAFNLI